MSHLHTQISLPSHTDFSKPSNELPSLQKPKKGIMFQPFDQKCTFLCKFCGGKTCKHENYLTYPNSAITGLNSDWITNNILATQRPSTRIIKEFNIIKQFKQNGINAIFNLQEPGEHPFCGDGISSVSGFSYFPEEFYENGIYFFNFGWPDMTATTTDFVFKIVKQMSFSLANGNKVAVHCHAGRGRTGLIIAAWMIYNDNISAKEAIKIVRSKRKEAITKKSQERLLYQFEKEIKEARMIFFGSPKYGLSEYLSNQKKLHASESNSSEKFVSKLVLVVLERLETLAKYNICKVNDILSAFYALDNKESFKENWSEKNERSLKQFKNKINTGSYEVSDIDDPRYLTQILLDFFEGFASSPIQSRVIDAIYSKMHEDNNDKLTQNIKDQIFKEMDRKEFFLLECFARFFASLLSIDETSSDQISLTALRVCISLTSSRKKLDKIFLKRSMISDHNEDDKVTHLKIFLLKWVENFNEGFTENFLLHKGSLRINERKVKETLIKKGLQTNSILSKILDKDPSNTSDSMSSIIEEEGECNEKDEEFTEITMASPPKLSNSFVRNTPHRTGIQRDVKVRALHLPKIVQEGTPKTDKSAAKSCPTSLTKKVNIRPFFTPKADVSFGRSPKRNLLKMGKNDLIEENVSDRSKVNIEKHYKSFFNEEIEQEKDNMADMMERITKMSEEKQDKIFKKLIEIQVGRHTPLKNFGY